MKTKPLMKTPLLCLTVFLILFNLNACKNETEAKVISTPKGIKASKSTPNSPSQINNNLNTPCKKGNTKLKEISFRSSIKKVKLGFYTEQVTRSRKFAKEEDIGKAIDTKRFTKIIPLEKTNLKKLYSIFLNYSKGDLDMAHCYEPRHYIWFEDSEGKMLSYIEICFQCRQLRHPKHGITIECQQQLDELALFVKSFR
jgi:hypothetical protein